MGYAFSIEHGTFEDYIRAYQRDGLIVLPNHSSDNNPKSLGYKNWQDPERAIAIPFDRLLWEVHKTGKLSALLGYNTVKPERPILAADIDLVKCFCENPLHTKNSDHGVECVTKAREWRRIHITEFRRLETEVSFSPSGGCHVWAKASNPTIVAKWLAPILQGIDSRVFIESVKGRGTQVLLPPSKIPAGYYFLLDCKGKLYLENNFRIREL